MKTKKFVKCKQCKRSINAILNPFQKVKEQLKAMFSQFCSIHCMNLKT